MDNIAVAEYHPKANDFGGYIQDPSAYVAEEPKINSFFKEPLPLWNQTNSIFVIIRPSASMPRIEGVKFVEEDQIQFKVKDVVSRFGLNKSQAASIFRVTRQSIYDWITSDHALKPDNQARFEQIIATLECVSEDDAPVLGRVLKYRITGGSRKLQDFLCSEQINADDFADAYKAMSKTFAQQKTLKAEKSNRSLSSSDEFKFLSV